MEKQKIVRVLVVVSQLNRGGLECRLMDILRVIDFDRVCIDIFTYHLEKGIMDDEAKELGCTIYYNKPLTIKNMYSYVDYFSDFLNKHPFYHIVHAHQDAWCSVFCKGAYKAGVPIRIAHSRTAISSFSLKNFAKNVIKIPTVKYATHFFAVSKKAGEWLFGKKLMSSGKVQIWKNAIDCNKYVYKEQVRQKMRAQLGVSDELVIMHVGNFTKPKNHEFIINVFEQLILNGINAKLVLVGADTSVEHNQMRIQAIVNEKMLADKVIFLGTRDDVYNVLQAGDVFLFPSIFEGLPGAVVEAQASGLPCVLSDTITKEVIILDSTIMLSLQTSPAMWAKRVEQLAGYERKNTLMEMKQAGFDIHSVVDDLTKFYESVEV